jgi:hypothetical protein
MDPKLAVMRVRLETVDVEKKVLNVLCPSVMAFVTVKLEPSWKILAETNDVYSGRST